MPADVEEEIRRGLAVLVEPGQVFEVRSWAGDRISSGYFNDLDAATTAISALDGAGPDGIYLTPNPVLPDLLARRANRIKGPLSKKDSSTADQDIIGRRWFLIDIDPARPSGVSSSDEEHARALERAATIAAALGDRGWPAPITGDSGNGAHLLYRVDLPNDEKSTALIKAALSALDAIFSDPVAAVDTAVYNASRIWKVYGTAARKGDSTDARPHRRSRLISVPDAIEVVTREQLAALAIADPAPPEPARPAGAVRSANGRRFGDPLDLGAWLRDYGIGVLDSRPYQGGTLYRLDSCPFSGAHSDGAFAIQFPSGGIHAGCHHASCGGGTQRWPELRERFEGPRPSFEQKEKEWRAKKIAAKNEATGQTALEPARVEPEADEATAAEAREILEHGDPLAFMVHAFNREHIGDQVLARCLALSLASRLVTNSKGLHVMTTGESGKGKSDGYRVMLRQIPDAYKLRGSFSDKSLYYKEDLRPQSVFVVDDKDLSDSIQEVLKEATSDFRESIEHHTLTTDRKPIVCRIPARCLWWVAKAEGTGDDQVLNRMLMVWVDESEEQDRAVLAGVLARELRDDDQPDGEPREVRVCRAMWERLARQAGLVEVNLSRFAHRIRFSSSRNRRNPIMLIDLIRSAAMLRYFQREHRTLEAGATRIYATEEDFTTAAAIFTALHGTSGSQDVKLTQREAQILDVIDLADLGEFTVLKLQALTRLPYQQIYRTFMGYISRGAKYSGLLEKCPALGTLDKSISSPDDSGSGTIRRRLTAFTFNREIYATWTRGGLVWLTPKDGDGPDSGGDDLQHLQQFFSSFSATAENESGRITPPNSGETIESARVQNREPSFSADRGSTQSTGSVSASVPVCVCDLPSAENEIAKLESRALFVEPGEENTPIIFSNCCKTAENVRKTSPSAENDGAGGNPAGFTIAQVSPADYSLIPDGVQFEPCQLCGGRTVHYTERFQARQARGPNATARRICQGCYTRARDREQSAVQVLPGTLPITEVESIAPGSIGRCDVCGLQAAAYRHAGSSTAICSRCYEKLVQAQRDIR